MASSDRGMILRTLAEASVQFIVVGEPAATGGLRLVVSRHPTNLDALGRALGALGSSLRSGASPAGAEPPGTEPAGAEPAGAEPPGTEPPGAGPPGTEAGAGHRAIGPSSSGPRRIGDPTATLSVRTAVGDVDLVFGGERRSLYGDTLERSEERDIDGTRVRWAAAAAPVEQRGRVTSRELGRRLLSVADGLAHVVEQRSTRQDKPPRDASARDQLPADVNDDA